MSGKYQQMSTEYQQMSTEYQQMSRKYQQSKIHEHEKMSKIHEHEKKETLQKKHFCNCTLQYKLDSRLEKKKRKPTTLFSNVNDSWPIANNTTVAGTKKWS